MSKKILFSTAIALAMVFSLAAATVFAEDGIMPINETGETTPVGDADVAPTTVAPTNETAGEISEPTGDTTSGDKIDLESGTDGDKAEAPVKDCNTENGEDCDGLDDETGEPEMWPMYVSLGALGAAILVFIILNLFSKRKH